MGPIITIYSKKNSPRLQYVLQWLFTEQLGLSWVLTHDLQAALNAVYPVFYGVEEGGMNIYAASLLWETSINTHDYQSNHWNQLYTLYYNEDSRNRIPFDIFSGIFFLLTRYEEYLPFTPDKHSRYPHTASILSKDNVLERPVLDEWVQWFGQLLIDKWQLKPKTRTFHFQPSYDIDIAWSYKNKGFTRWAGAAFRDLAKGNFSALVNRCKVSLGKAPDPYDAFGWMNALHEKYLLKPYYFILSAINTTDFDKNIPLSHPGMKKLVQQAFSDGEIGIHPSFYTRDNDTLFLAEKELLAKTAGCEIMISRQHYIRLFFPDTYRMLISGGIQADYSMGYSTTFGFRAGTSHSFLWYDLKNEQVTTLRIYPFCFMDTTAHYDLELSVGEAFKQLETMKEKLQQTGGVLTTVLHNFSLGTDAEWKGWSNAYEHFIQRTNR